MNLSNLLGQGAADSGFLGLPRCTDLAGLDIVEFMPSRDIGGLAALNAARLLATAIGLMARQRR